MELFWMAIFQHQGIFVSAIFAQGTPLLCDACSFKSYVMLATMLYISNIDNLTEEWLNYSMVNHCVCFIDVQI